MPAYLAKDANLWLGNQNGLVDLLDGSGSFSITGACNTVTVQGLGRDAVTREGLSVDNRASIQSIYEDTSQAFVRATSGGTSRALVFYNVRASGVSGTDCLAGTVLTEEFELATPYSDLVNASGTLPGNAPWIRSDATGFSFTGSGSSTVTPSGSYSQAYLIIYERDSTWTPSWTWAGSAIPISGTGILGPVETTNARLVLSSASGAGGAKGIIAAGVPIAVP